MIFRSKLEKYIEKELPSHLLGNSHVAIFDTETTGFSKLNNDLISLSCEVRDFNWDLKDETTLYSAPMAKKRWSQKAEKVHGFSYGEACSFDHPRKTAINLLHFLKPFKHPGNHPILFVSHDLNGFDWGFMEWLYRWQDLQYSFWKVFNEGYKLSTIKMAREQGHQGNKLNEWADRLDFELNHHEVKSDRVACAKVFKHLIEENNELDIGK